MSALPLLVSLRDVRGVEGSFLLRMPGGEIVTRDGLQVLSDASLAETARRLSSLFLALGDMCPGSEEAVLRFEGLSLFARKNARVLLGVLAGESASLPALRMGTSLVLRQLEGLDLAAVSALPAPEAAATPAASPRFWRGSPV
jgi:hypothetical protein